MDIPQVKILRSRRRTAAIQITPQGEVIFRAPLNMPRREIERILTERRDWIDRKLSAVREDAAAGRAAPLSQEDLAALARQAKQFLMPLVEQYAARMGVTYGRITIRCQQTRWGSCSSKGNLNFNCLLMLAPRQVVTYVVVHELAHRKHMDHSPAFWAEVEAILPDYRESVRWLKTNGGKLLARARQEIRDMR